MKKAYSGLEAIKVSMDAKDQICVSNECFSIVTLVRDAFDNCISPVDMRVVEWYLQNE